jgi:hypothetical protein
MLTVRVESLQILSGCKPVPWAQRRICVLSDYKGRFWSEFSGLLQHCVPHESHLGHLETPIERLQTAIQAGFSVCGRLPDFAAKRRITHQIEKL